MKTEYKLKRIIYGDGRIVYQVIEKVEVFDIHIVGRAPNYQEVRYFADNPEYQLAEHDGYISVYSKIHYSTSSEQLARPHLERLQKEQVAKTVISKEEL